MSISIQPSSSLQPIAPISRVGSVRTVDRAGEIGHDEFAGIMMEEVAKAIPTVPVSELKSVDFKGVSDFVEHREYVNAVVPYEMNRLAASFQNKVAFYDASGSAEMYDFTSFDQRI